MGEAKRRKMMGERMVWIEEFNCYVPAALMKTVYTFVDMNGVNTNINAAALREWCLSNHLEISLAPIDHKLANSFIHENVISPQRIKQMFANPKLLDEPVIFCKDGTYGKEGHPNVMLVDGHHRYFIHAYMKLKYINCYILNVEQWKPFQMHNIPSVTREQLQRVPVVARDYHK